MTAAFSTHALERMTQRGIDRETVQSVLDNPDNLVPENGLNVYQRVLPDAGGKAYLYRVFVNEQKLPPLVVTVYRTSNIRKYAP